MQRGWSNPALPKTSAVAATRTAPWCPPPSRGMCPSAWRLWPSRRLFRGFGDSHFSTRSSCSGTSLSLPLSLLLLLLASVCPARWSALSSHAAHVHSAAVHSCTKPKLFLIGDGDQFAGDSTFFRHCASFAEPRESVVVEGLDHFFFDSPKLGRMEIEMLLASLIMSWFTREVMRPAGAGTGASKLADELADATAD